MHAGVTVGEIAVAAVDVRTRRGRDAGARWRAEVLAHQFGDERVLAIDLELAREAERYLVNEVQVTPGSARKLVRQLLALRRGIAAALHAPQLPDDDLGPILPAGEPWVSLDEYATLRSGLDDEDRVATDLIVGCRLRPATVLRIGSDDVGPGGWRVRVRGRRRSHVIPVPAFAREGLALLAWQVGPGAPLFPGRSPGSTLHPATLRRRVQGVAAERSDKQVDLRDLGRLAELVLGPSSGNPAGRLAALRRIAADWVEVGSPPGWETEEVVEDDQGVVWDEIIGLFERVIAAEGRLERLEVRASEAEEDAASMERETNWLFAQIHSVREGLKGHEQDDELHGGQGQVPESEMQAVFRRIGRALGEQGGRIDRLVTDTATRREVDDLRDELDKTSARSKKTSDAVLGLALVVGALLGARIHDLGGAEELQRLLARGGHSPLHPASRLQEGQVAGLLEGVLQLVYSGGAGETA